MIPLFVFIFLIVLALLAFILVAKKGRKLRTSRPRPPVATKAYLEWRTEEGESQRKEVTTPFYFGKSSSSDLALADARKEYEVCIFHHDRRFAYQALEGSDQVLVNGEELIAGYLSDGDLLEIAGKRFVFRCS